MQLKSGLHLHSKEDPWDESFIKYSFCEAIDRAAELDFQVLAITLHDKWGYSTELARYAKEKGILLIPGIEKLVQGKHVVILNSKKDIEKINTFQDLREYKKNNPEIFILATHPYFFGKTCLKNKLVEYIDIFDGIENSWCYSKLVNWNKKAQKVAEKYNLPFISTSDTHFLKYLDVSYTVINTEKADVELVLSALKKGRIVNYSKPVRFWRDMIKTEIRMLRWRG